MDNEEKKVKDTTPKKKTTKTTTKKVAKTSTKTKKPVKKDINTKTETKKASTKTVKKDVAEKKVEIKKENEENTFVKETKVITKEAKPSKELLEIRKKRYMIEIIIVAIVVFIALLFLLNRTFLKTKYTTDKVDISIPRFTYYISDKDNAVKFMTLRKSEYLNEYFNEYLEGFTFYSCAEGTNTFYYSETTKTLIKEIKVEKKFALKTVTVTYDTRSPEEVCGIK